MSNGFGLLGQSHAPPSGRQVTTNLTLGAFGVFLLASHAGCQRSSVSEQPSASSSAASAALLASSPVPIAKKRLAARLWEPGKTYQYHYSMSNQTLVGGGLPMVDLSISGNLNLVAQAESSNGVQVLLRMPTVKVVASKTGTQTQYDAMTKELALPYLAIYRDGILREERVSKGIGRVSEGIIRHIAASLQLGLTAPAGSDRWEVTEFDATGEYVTGYRTVSAGIIAKQKQRYAKLPVVAKSPTGAEQVNVTPEVEASESTYDISSGTLTHVQGKETLATAISASSKLTSATEISIELKEASTAPALDWTKFAGETVLKGSGVSLSPASQSDQFDDVRIGKLTFDEVLGEMEKGIAKGGRKRLVQSVNMDSLGDESVSENRQQAKDDAHVFRAAAALIRRDPANIAIAVGKIKSHAKISKILMDALGSADSPAAQAALVSLMQDKKLSDDERRDAASALIASEAATEQTVAALTSELHADPVHLHAVLGLGTIARKLQRDGKMVRASAIADRLLVELGEASTEERRIEVLRAIANSANVRALNAVVKFLKDDSPDTRGAAVEAIRLMDSDRVDVYLVEQLTWEQADSVRSVAVSAIGIRAPNSRTLHAVTQAARFDKVSSVRLRATDVLGKWFAKRPDIKDTLTAIANGDSNQRVQETAKKYLETPPS